MMFNEMIVVMMVKVVDVEAEAERALRKLIFELFDFIVVERVVVMNGMCVLKELMV